MSAPYCFQPFFVDAATAKRYKPEALTNFEPGQPYALLSSVKQAGIGRFVCVAGVLNPTIRTNVLLSVTSSLWVSGDPDDVKTVRQVYLGQGEFINPQNSGISLETNRGPVDCSAAKTLVLPASVLLLAELASLNDGPSQREHFPSATG